MDLRDYELYRVSWKKFEIRPLDAKEKFSGIRVAEYTGDEWRVVF